MSHPESIKEYPLSTQIIIKRIHNRIDAGKNALVIICGQTGAGKSLAALQIMRGLYLYRYGKEPENKYLIDHTFFRATKFMEAMRDLSNDLVDDKKKLIKGQSWLWDEVGVEAGHKESMTVRNKVVGWLAQTFRNLQQVIFFTTPSISFIDASIRKLIHYYIEAHMIDLKKKVCVCRALELQYNVRMDKIYYHNFKYPTNEGVLEVDFIAVPKISDELEQDYDIKKNRFTSDLNEEILSALRRVEKTKESAPLTLRQEEILSYLKQNKSPMEIAKVMGQHNSNIYVNLNFMRRKGVDVDKFLRKSTSTHLLYEKPSP